MAAHAALDQLPLSDLVPGHHHHADNHGSVARQQLVTDDQQPPHAQSVTASQDETDEQASRAASPEVQVQLVRGNHDLPDEIEQASLPRTDGGKDAWMFLVAGFMLEALIWGFPFSYGIFQEYYAKTEPFASHPSGLAIIGTCESGIMYLGSPFTLSLLQLYPRVRAKATIPGLFILVLALVLSSFATSVWQLMLTQGVLYAIGGSILYSPALLYVDDWFVKRKGLAFGVMWAGSGSAGVVVPFLMSWLLNNYGFRTTLRIWAVVVTVLIAPLLYYVKPRIPVSKHSSSTPRRVSLTFLRSSTFWFLQMANILEGLGFFIPSIYIPSYAQSLAMPAVSGSLVLALVNATTVIGTVGLGMLSDYVHITTVTLISAIGSTLSVFLLWGFSTSLPLLCVFGLFYGLFAGGYSSSWPGSVVEIKRKVPGTETSVVLGLLTAGRGIGAVCSGPLSEALLKGGTNFYASSGYDTGYSSLIIFTGVTALFGGLGFLGRQVKLV